MTTLAKDYTTLQNVHDISKCAPDHCIIHNPSTHHMSDWELVWRNSKGIFERQCPHGIGHPDPDDVAHLSRIDEDWAGVHGCDGCCSTRDN